MSFIMNQSPWLIAATLSILLATTRTECSNDLAGLQRADDNNRSRPAVSEVHKFNRMAQPGGASRAYGGRLYGERDQLNFMVPLYRNPNNDELIAPGDGYLTGYGLLVRNLTMIIHNQVLERASQVVGTQLVLRGWGWTNYGANSFFFPKQIWARDKDNWNHWDEGYYPRMMANLGPNVSMVFLEFQNKSALFGQDCTQPMSHNSFYRHRFTAFTVPELNSNVSLKENCYAYVHALDFADWKTYKDWSMYNERRFARWPVKLQECLGSLCRFSPDYERAPGPRNYGEICQTWQDVGVPIMCSSKEPKEDSSGHLDHKLSYMVIGTTRIGSEDGAGCTRDFYALRLADFYTPIMKALSLGSPGAICPAIGG